MNRGDWSLIGFTLGVQVACGLQLAALAADLFAGRGASGPANAAGLLVVPVLATSVAASVLHLGRPLQAWRSLSNVSRSPLSREIVAMASFGAAALAYAWTCVAGLEAFRMAAGVAASVAALAAVVSSALVYTVPARPVWRSWWVPGSFLAAALLVSGSASAVQAEHTGASALHAVASASILLGGLVMLVSALRMVSRRRALAAPDTDPSLAVGARPVETTPQRWAFAGHVVLAAILPTAMAIWTLADRGAGSTARVALVLLLGPATVAGSGAGRWLMFSLGSSVPKF